MTINGIQLSVNVQQPILSSTRKTFYGSAILLSNAGDEDVMINRGLTITAGNALTIKTGDDGNMAVFEMSIKFAGGGINPRLEVVTILQDLPEYVNYKVNG